MQNNLVYTRASKSKTYIVNLLYDGFASYGMSEKPTYLPKEVAKDIAFASKGLPVVVGHIDNPKEQIDASIIVGDIVEVIYNDKGIETNDGNIEPDCLLYAKISVFIKEAQELLDNGYKVSITYIANNSEPATHHDIACEKIIAGTPHHLAIVQNPRFNDTKVFSNSTDISQLNYSFSNYMSNQEQAKNTASTSNSDVKDGIIATLINLVKDCVPNKVYANSSDMKDVKENEDEKKED